MSLRIANLRESLLRRTASIDHIVASSVSALPSSANHIVASSVAAPPPSARRAVDSQRQCSPWSVGRTRSSFSRGSRPDRATAAEEQKCDKEELPRARSSSSRSSRPAKKITTEDARVAAVDAALEASLAQCPLQCPPPPQSWMAGKRPHGRERASPPPKSQGDALSVSSVKTLRSESRSEPSKEAHSRSSTSQLASRVPLECPERHSRRQASAQKLFGNCHPAALVRTVASSDATDRQTVRKCRSRSPQSSDDWMPDLAAELNRRQKALMEKELALELLRQENEKLRATAENGWHAAHLFYQALHSRSEDTESEIDQITTSKADELGNSLSKFQVEQKEEEISLEDVTVDAGVEDNADELPPTCESSAQASSAAHGSIHTDDSTNAVVSMGAPSKAIDSAEGISSRRVQSVASRAKNSMVAQICAEFEDRLQLICDGTGNGAPSSRKPLAEKSSPLRASHRISPGTGDRIAATKSECGTRGNPRGAQQQNGSPRVESAGLSPSGTTECSEATLSPTDRTDATH